jgi:lipoate-protein ligase A
MTWRFENTHHRSGAFNMQYDASLAQRLVWSAGPPTLRVYGWRPWAISLGCHQRLDEIDLISARADDIDVVYRPTGGRAILHAEEITYSVTLRTTEKPSALYERINQALVCGLRLLGVGASLETTQANFPVLYRHPSSAVCFSSSARHEVKFNGKKLVGSAQRRFRASDGSVVVLQHGSLLLGPSHRAIVDYLSGITEEERNRLRDILQRKTVDLQEILGREVEFEEAAEALRRGFTVVWNAMFDAHDGVEFIPSRPREFA